jgi:hypothetical protein
VRSSVTADRIVGAHRVSVAFAADVFATDRLRGVAGATPPATAPAGGVDAATVRLGPVYTTDLQLQLAARGLRELLVYASHRYRAPYSRDGDRVASTSGAYLESGVRGARALRPGLDLMLALDGRHHTGLGVDQGLATMGVTALATTVSLAVRRGAVTVQPFGRMQVGSLRPTGLARADGARAFGATAIGLVAAGRF